VEKEDAQKAVELMRKAKYGEHAQVIGSVTAGEAGTLLVKTPVGGTRIVSELYGEGLPRIC
jgi:hydrogenase expression/formation protein HypE